MSSDGIRLYLSPNTYPLLFIIICSDLSHLNNGGLHLMTPNEEIDVTEHIIIRKQTQALQSQR